MNDQSRPSSSRLAAAIVVAALVIGAAILASSYFGTATTVTRTSTATSIATSATTVSSTIVSTGTADEGPLLYTSGVSPDGLQLNVVLNSSSMQSHGAITAQIEVVNTLNENVTAQELVPSQNISDWNPYGSLCPDQNPTASIVGFAIFKGRFSAGNISEAGAPLHMAPQFFPPGCGTEWGFPSSVTFLPESGQMNASFNNAPQPPPPPALLSAALNATTFYCGGAEGIDCGLSPGLVGYWNYNIPNSGGDLTLSSPALVYFSPGEYTIVATDVWNQYVYAYFVVA